MTSLVAARPVVIAAGPGPTRVAPSLSVVRIGAATDPGVRPLPVVVRIGQSPGPRGEDGPPGSSFTITYPAVTALSGQRAVLYDPAFGGWVYASRVVAEHAAAALGITVGAASIGASAEALMFGQMDEIGWNWPAPCALWLDSAGVITATPPASGYQRQVAHAITPTRIVWEPQPALHLAA